MQPPTGTDAAGSRVIARQGVLQLLLCNDAEYFSTVAETWRLLREIGSGMIMTDLQYQMENVTVRLL